jgi:signal transduction histidine kinase
LDRPEIRSGAPFVFRVSGWSNRFRAIRHLLPGGGSVTLGVWDLEAMALNRRLAWLFVWTWLGLFILGSTMSWLLARSILRGVERIAVAAESIDSQQLDVRVPVPRGRNEIAFLAMTFNRMLDRIEASVHQIRVMTDALAHDLRSPVTAIRGHLELAATQPDSHSRKEAVAVALDGLDKLLRILDTNLDIAEAEGGALRLNLQDLDLSILAGEMISFYMPVIEEKGLSLFLVQAPAVRLRADADLLRRALANLLDNAVRHLPAGCRVEVQVKQTPGGILLTISDDGPGFPDSLQDHAFDRFARGQSSEGSGLGLALVRAVIRAHGGEATLGRSVLGGAMICLDLPRAATA